MNTRERWATYLDPEAPSGIRDRTRSGMARGEAGALDRIGEILADEAVWGSPSTDMRANLIAQASSEAVRSVDHDRDDEPPANSNDQIRRLGWFGSGLVAAAIILFFVVAPLADRGDVTTYAIAGTAFAPELEATVDVEPLASGVAITLHIEGLPPAGEGQYYAAWLRDPDDSSGGTMVGIGSLHAREGGIPIELWSGVDTERYPVFMVTLQNEDQPPIPSEVVVMKGQLTERESPSPANQ